MEKENPYFLWLRIIANSLLFIRLLDQNESYPKE